jgi:hypothetical protein
MQEYQKVFARLRLDERLGKLASGAIRVPLVGAESPPTWYSFPPALLPLWSHRVGPTYVGAWKHWFVDRKLTYVRMSVADGRLAVEIARTAEQLLVYAIIAAIREQDGVTERIERFARAMDVRDVEGIERIARLGDGPASYVHLKPFASHVPLACVGDFLYTGDWPLVASNGLHLNLGYCSEFELDPEQVVKARIGARLPWLTTVERSRAAWFEQCIRDKNFGEAWLALNARGWSIADAREAITRLAANAQDEQFDLLASAWLSVANQDVGGY